MFRVSPLVFLVLAACASAPAAAPAPVAPPPVKAAAPAATPRPAPTPPAFRLPTGARPLAYVAELTIDPGKPAFTGRIGIDLELTTATDVLWLHAQELHIDAALVDGVGAVQIVPAPPMFVGLQTPAPLGPGPVHVDLAYHGKAVRGDSLGFFVQQVGSDWYGATQFEATYARMVFPCFDEPAWKTPWTLTLRVPKDLVAVSNTPVASQTVDDASGLATVRFQKTPPLPSYLVAFAIGPYDVVDAGKSASGTPVRVLTPRGQAAEAAYAAQVTVPLLSLLEGYFGTPHPFAKLDFVPVPQAFGFSAMENPGMITYLESILLQKPDEQTLLDRRLFAQDAVHEMAHQWLGNLVTSAWWDDLWLNEALSTWMEAKILSQWKPAWGIRVDEVRGNAVAMHHDDVDSARRVREPVRDDNDIENAFDGVTYDKGATVMRMLELWIGEDAFQKGLRAYLAKRAWGVATYADFVADMSESVGKDLSGPLASFLDQNGVPEVAVELHCEAGAPARLALSQKRYLPIGSNGDRDRLWQVPVCVRYGGGGGKSDTACTLLTGSAGELELPASARCPDWVVPNQGGNGYYRGVLAEAAFARVTAPRVLARLPAEDRLALREDAAAQVASGGLDLAGLLDLDVRLAGDASRQVREAVIDDLWSLDDWLPDPLRPRYQRLVRRVFGAAARKIGFQPRAGESEDVALYRPTLLHFVADAGDDAVLLDQASTLAWAWVADHRAVAPELVDTVLQLAASRGELALYDRLRTSLRQSPDLQERQRLIAALGAFRDATLVGASLELVLAEELPISETLDLLEAAAAWRGTREQAWRFLVEHHDAIAARLPLEKVAGLIELGRGTCTEARRDELAAFFRERSTRALGGPRVYAQTLEMMTLCIADQQRNLPSLTQFLEKTR